MCETYRDLLPAFAAGSLAEDDRAHVEAHLLGCPGCRRAASEWRVIGGAVRGLVAARDPGSPPYLAPDMPPAGEVAVGPRGRRLPAGGSVWLGLILLLAISLPLVLRLLAGSSGRTIEPRSLDLTSLVDGSPGMAPHTGRPAAPAIVARGVQPTIVARGVRPIQRVRAPSPPVAVGAARPADSGPDAPAPPPDAGVGALAAGAATVGASPAAGTPVGLALGSPAAAAAGSGEPREVPGTATPPPTATETPVPTTGTLSGLVRGPDGQPRAEILIVAEPEAGGGDAVSGYTDVDGAYTLELPPGLWIVHAETPAYQLMWHPGKPNPIAAAPVAVTLGMASAVDFALEPSPAGLVTGRVTDAGGAPVARAAVIAAIPDDGADDGPALGAAVFTDAAGEYRLALPPGTYYLAATRSRRVEGLAWWGGDGTFEQADRIGVEEGEPVVGINLTLR